MTDADRTIVGGLPWIRRTFDDDEKGRRDETWYVEIDGLYVWVKHYPDDARIDSFRGWRVGRGGSPLSQLNDRQPWPDREAAMLAARRVAVLTARDQVQRAGEAMAAALATFTEVAEAVTPGGPA